MEDDLRLLAKAASMAQNIKVFADRAQSVLSNIVGVGQIQRADPLQSANAGLAEEAGGGTHTTARRGELAVTIPMPMGMSFDGTETAGSFVTKMKPGSNAELLNVKVVLSVRSLPLCW